VVKVFAACFVARERLLSADMVMRLTSVFIGRARWGALEV
jgi:hypothetical protein